MFLVCLVFAMFCACLFICALWSPAGKGLTSWLSFVVSTVSLSLSHWYPGSGVVLNLSIPDLCTLTYFNDLKRPCHCARKISSYCAAQLIRFARVCFNVDHFNNRNLFLTAKILKQGYRYHKIRKAFSKFYYRHSELIVKYYIGLKIFCNRAYQNLYLMVI